MLLRVDNMGTNDYTILGADQSYDAYGNLLSGFREQPRGGTRTYELLK